MVKSLLIEIGVEELPAIPLLKTIESIKNTWEAVLCEYNLQSEFEFYYTPRRLVLFHAEFAEFQKDSFIEIIGAPRSVAFKDGKITAAGQSFLAKAGISEAQIEFKEIKGKEVLYHKALKKGEKSVNLLGFMIKKWLESLNFGKAMRWGRGEFEFIRAVRSLVCVLGDESVDFEAFGVKSAMKSFVHRSVSYEALDFKGISDYFSLLKNNFVILDQNERKSKILAEFKDIERKFGVKIADDDELLSEVVAITEYPSAILGGFEKDFLQIPSEVIILSMRENQRYFSVFRDENLANNFICVSNAICENADKIIAGNERVLKARLSDAMFFWQNDLKTGLQPKKLADTIYLKGLGTLADKAKREFEVARALCDVYKMGDLDEISRAITYAKADLQSQMVYEFPELQGVMGSYYAKAANFSDQVCLAIREQYLPKGENDAMPSAKFSSIVALANKLDTLMGLFSLNLIPTGTKDPYALRRGANGLIKIVLNLGEKFDLREILNKIAPNYAKFDLAKLENFIFERLFTLYNANASFINAVLSSQNTEIISIDASIKTLINLSKKADFSENFSTFKRLANIAVKGSGEVNEKLFETSEEKALFTAFKKIDLNAEVSVVLNALFGLKPEIDAFFDKVMINVENAALKNNRQVLVRSIYEAFLNIADIKELSV